MAKINLIKNNFTSGELSPHIWMRTDLQQYRNGTKEMLNFLPIVEGGLKRRGGTEKLANTAGAVRILPFLLSHEQAYILVFKEYEITVLDKTGQLIWTLTTPYEASEIKEITYCQSKYSFYLAHGNHPLAWIRTSEDLTNWSYDIYQYSVPPLEEITTPEAVLTPSATATGATCTLTASKYAQYDKTKQYITGDICWNINGGVKRYFKALQMVLDHAPSTTVNEYWEETTVSTTEIFTTADIGKYIFINQGIVRVTQLITAEKVAGEIVVKLNASIEAIEGSWIMKQAIFTSDLGFPKTITMYQQRLVLGGTKTYPGYIWFSRVGDEANFLPTTEDGDSFTISASSDQLTTISHLSQSRGVVIHTAGSEFVINATNALTPTSANIMEQSTYGTAVNIRPIKVGNEVLFIQRGAERLRTLVYDYSQDSLVSNELTVLASHIAKKHGGFKEMIYAQEPDSIVWFLMGDGTLATLTLNREQSVIAFAHHEIGSSVLSIMTLPSETGSDSVYFLVNRKGTLQIERLNEKLLLDSATAVTVNHGTPCTVTDPLIGLLGDEVAAYFTDGIHSYSIPILSRDGDTLTIECDKAITKIFVGRKFTSKVSLFAPELQGSPATSSPSIIKINHINLYLYESLNPTVNGEMVELKQFTESFKEAPKPFTGNKRIEMNGWADFDNFKLIIEQSEPLPLHITAVVMEQNINDR